MFAVDVFEPLLENHPERSLRIIGVHGSDVAVFDLGAPEPRPFALGSISKLFTGLALAVADELGEAALGSRLGAFVPETRTNPRVADVRLDQLASHASGLPREAPSLLRRYEEKAVDDENPYGGFSEEDLVAALLEAIPSQAPGTYSNFGFQALALALARAARLPFPTLVRERILTPLGLSSIAWHADGDPGGLAQGHDAGGNPVPRWSELLPGPGGYWATATAFASFLGHALEGEEGAPLQRSIALCMRPVSWPRPGRAIGLAWLVSGSEPSAWHWHNGGSGGFHAFTAVQPSSSRAVAVFANWTSDGNPAELVTRALVGIPN